MSEPRPKRSPDSERRARQGRGPGPREGGPRPGRRPPTGAPREGRGRPRREGDIGFADEASTATRLDEQGKRRGPGSDRGRRRGRPRSGGRGPGSPEGGPPKKKAAFEIRRGEYYKGPVDEDELQPLDQVTLPKSILQEDEEKDFRRRFGRKSDDEVVNIYEKHSAVTISSNTEEEVAKRKGGVLIWIFVILVLLGAAAGGVYMFRAELEPYLSEYGIELPK